MGELEDGAHAVGAGGDGDDVLGVLDGDDDAGGEHELLPGLGKVDHVQSVSAALPDVRDLKSSQTTSARHNRAPR
mgnify:CR=1 FL=1